MLNLYRVFFIISVFGILFIKQSYILALILLFLSIVSAKDFLKLHKRVIKSIFLFNLGVSLGYIILSSIKGVDFWEYIIYINLKVYTMSFFLFLFFKRVNLLEFFSFSKDLSYLLSISISMIISYKKSFEDFRLAYKARVVRKLQERERGFITKVFEFFLSKAMKDSKQRALAMRARGFFD